MTNNFRVVAVRVFVVFSFLVAYLAASFEVDNQSHCHIRNCTQNPRQNYHEGIFHCAISDCSRQKQEYQDPGSSSYEDFSPILRKLSIYEHNQFAAVNLTLSLPVKGIHTDLPATSAIRMEFWSDVDTNYSVCKSFNFSPQRASSAIPPREITYCGLTGLYQGTDELRETPYFLRLTAFPTGASITYHLIYQGWTFEEEARLRGLPAAVWKPLIAAAVRPGSGNIHVVVESPPQEFSVHAMEFALFCGKEGKDGGVPRKSFSRKLPKDEPHQLVYEFHNLPHEKCAVKVTPACANQNKCRESWSAWLPRDPPCVSAFAPHPSAVMIAVPVAVCVVITVAVFIVYRRRRRQCKTQRGDPEVQECIDVTLVSNAMRGGCPQKELVDAFGKLLEALGFSITRIEGNETAPLQSLLQRTKVIVLLCLPRPNQHRTQEEGWYPTVLSILGRDPELQQKCVLGCLQTRDLGHQPCSHFPVSHWAEAEEGGNRENDAAQPLCSPPVFPYLADKDSFHEFYKGILRKAGCIGQPHSGYERKDAWSDLIEKLSGCTLSDNESEDSLSIGSSGSSETDQEHQSSSSSSEEDQASLGDDSSSDEVQASTDTHPRHPATVPLNAGSSCEIGPGRHHQRQEDGGSGRVASSQHSFRGTPGCVQGNRLSNHSVGDHLPMPERESTHQRNHFPPVGEDHAGHRAILPNGGTTLGWGCSTNCTTSAAHQGCHVRSPPCLAQGVGQAHTCCGQHHCGHFEPLGFSSDSGCPGNSVFYRGVGRACSCQFHPPQNPALSPNYWGNCNWHPHNGNFSPGHHHCGNAVNGTCVQGATRPACPRSCSNCTQHGGCHHL